MKTLTNQQIKELKELIADYDAECKANEEAANSPTFYDDIDNILNLPDEATRALLKKYTELELPLSTNTTDYIRSL